MGYIKGADRRGVKLMPDSLEDYVSANNPVRVIDAFVEQLYVGALGFKAEPANEGRPGYDSRDIHIRIPGQNPFITEVASRGGTQFRIDVVVRENSPVFSLYKGTQGENKNIKRKRWARVNFC